MRNLILICFLVVIQLYSHGYRLEITKKQFDFSCSMAADLSRKEFDPRELAETESKENSLKAFKELADEGLQRFRMRDLDGAIALLKQAVAMNGTQPLGQLGIFLYCNESYDEAEKYLAKDIKKIEYTKMFKATDFRIWRSAALRKLNRTEDAIDALDLKNFMVPGVWETRLLMNYTLEFYGERKSIDDMIQLVGNVEEKDFTGKQFFGNFYLGLYYDSINNKDMAELFLTYPKESRKYKENDMWFHLPRVLYDKRFPPE